MTLDEKLRLIFGYSDQAITEVAKVPDDIVSPELKTYVQTRAIKGSAGFVPGVPRLGIPDQMADRRLDGRTQQLHPEHRFAVLACHRRELRSRGLESGRSDDRRGNARDRPQHHAVGRREPRPRAAERPQLRIYRRRSAARRNHGRGADRGHPVQQDHLDDQALCGERRRDPADDARRDHLRRGDAPVRPAGVRVRHRARVAGLGDVLLQPHQRPLGLRERLSPQHRPQGRLGLQGLRHERLGRGPFDGLRPRTTASTSSPASAAPPTSRGSRRPR